MDEQEADEAATSDIDAEATRRLLAKLRVFIGTQLDDAERGVFAMLIAPALARAYEVSEDVTGFGVDEERGPRDIDWLPDLPSAVADELRNAGVRVVGIDDQLATPPDDRK